MARDPRIEVLLLAEQPRHIPLLAAWLASEWGSKEAEAEARFAQALTEALNCDRFPAALLACSDDQPAGVAMLKLREVEGALSMEHWLGSLYVAPEYRGRGLAKALVRLAEKLASAWGVGRLHLYTRSKQALYASLGWRELQAMEIGGRPAMIMIKDL